MAEVLGVDVRSIGWSVNAIHCLQVASIVSTQVLGLDGVSYYTFSIHSAQFLCESNLLYL